MADTIAITCPQCRKTINVPAALRGKKIRCKACGATLTVGAKPAPAGQVKQPAPPLKVADDDASANEEWGIIKSYEVGTTKEKARCPYCATELENETDIVCLNCGYNLQTRERVPQRILEPVTAGDYFMWWLPAFLNILGALFCVAIIIMTWVGRPSFSFIYMGWTQKYLWSRTYVTILMGFIIFACLRWAFKRLILDPHPPEREKKIKKIG
jgi:uncharacterized paraquat-inducible protein A